MPGTRAIGMFLRLTCWREHVVIHGDDHGNEHNAVIEKMKFHARKEELQHAERDRLAHQIVVERGLSEQKKMFDVMPELDDESNCPPCAAATGKAFAKHPEADKHDQRIAVVQCLGLDEPRIPEPENAIRLRARPPHHPYLVGLYEMLTPVCKHDRHKDL